MVALFKNRSPATIIWLFILSIVVHSNFFINSPVVKTTTNDGLLSIFLNNNIGILSQASIIIYHTIVILQALRLNYLFTDNRMFNKVNYLVAMVYILLTGITPEWSTLNPALIANFLVIWLFAKTLQLYSNPNPKTLLFNIGLIIGFCVLLYQPSALLLLVAFFALMALRPFNITEWFVLPMGVLAPFYFLASYLYLTDEFTTMALYIPDWQFHLPYVKLTATFYVTTGLILLILLIGLLHKPKDNRNILIQVRKNWSVLLVMLLTILPIPFINKNAGIESFLLWLVPASPFMAKGFLAAKNNTFPDLMFWCLLASAIINSWGLIKY